MPPVLHRAGGPAGSGSINRILRWLSANQVGDSAFGDDGTNVGISVARGVTWALGTSFVLPSVAGAAPTADGDLLYDTTNKRVSLGGDGVPGSVPRVLSVQQSTSDTILNTTTNATVSPGAIYATQYSIPANLLRTNKLLRVSAVFLLSSPASSTTVQFRVRLGSTAVYVGGTGTASSLTALSVTFVWYLWGTAAPGASVSVGCAGVHGAVAGTGTIGAMPNTVGPEVAAIATNGALALSLAILYGANTPTVHSYSLRMLMVEELN